MSVTNREEIWGKKQHCDTQTHTRDVIKNFMCRFSAARDIFFAVTDYVDSRVRKSPKLDKIYFLKNISLDVLLFLARPLAHYFHQLLNHKNLDSENLHKKNLERRPWGRVEKYFCVVSSLKKFPFNIDRVDGCNRNISIIFDAQEEEMRWELISWYCNQCHHS